MKNATHLAAAIAGTAWTAVVLPALAPRAAAAVPERLRVMPVNGIEIHSAKLTTEGGAAPALRVAFRKSDNVRRMLPLELRPAAVPAGTQTVAVRLRLQTDGGAAARLGLVLYETDGESWAGRTGPLASSAEPVDVKISLARLRRTEFSGTADGKLDTAGLDYAWLGPILDGPANGSLEVLDLEFSDAPYTSTTPLPLMSGATTWTLGHDPAIKASVQTNPTGGKDGHPAMREEFTLPGRKHMYCTASVSLPDEDIQGLKALRFTYRAALPNGIRGLLVMLSENSGSQYYADPAPGPATDWTTVTIPLDTFKLGTWTKDNDGKLTLGDVRTLLIGMHGTATDETATGFVETCDLELVP